MLAGWAAEGLCRLGLWLGAHSAHSPSWWGLEEGGSAVDGHTMDGPVHPIWTKALCSLKLVIIIGPNPPSHHSSSAWQILCPVMSQVRTSVCPCCCQGINGLFLLLCYPHLSYGISTPTALFISYIFFNSISIFNPPQGMSYLTYGSPTLYSISFVPSWLPHIKPTPSVSACL